MYLMNRPVEKITESRLAEIINIHSRSRHIEVKQLSYLILKVQNQDLEQ